MDLGQKAKTGWKTRMDSGQDFKEVRFFQRWLLSGLYAMASYSRHHKYKLLLVAFVQFTKGSGSQENFKNYVTLPCKLTFVNSGDKQEKITDCQA